MHRRQFLTRGIRAADAHAKHHGLCGRTLLWALLAVLFCGLAPAQIIGLELKNAKTAKKYKKWTIEKKGKPMIVGYPLEGIEVTPDGQMNRGSVKFIKLVVAHPKRPDLEIMRATKKGPIVVRKKSIVDIEVWDLPAEGGMHLLMRGESLIGLRTEYLRRIEEIEDAESRLRSKDLKLGSEMWFTIHRGVLADLDKLEIWLRQTLWPSAAKGIARSYTKWLKRAGKAAARYRIDLARKSIKDDPVSDDFLKFARSAGFGGVRWYGVRANHVRIISKKQIAKAANENHVLLAERIVEGFRADYVEPYLGEHDEDPIPRDLLVDYYLLPNDQELAAKMMRRYQGQKLSDQEAGVMGIARAPSRDGGLFIQQWRTAESDDIEGLVAYSMGQMLCAIVFNDRQLSGPGWMDIGFGYLTSFDYLNRNVITSFDWETNVYARQDPEEGEKTIQQGMRASFIGVALSCGRTVHDLMALRVAGMNDSDFAKAWSFLDFLVTKHKPILWDMLHACGQCHDINTRRTDLERLRPRLEKLFKIEPKTTDVYRFLEEEWKKFAKNEQASMGRMKK